MSKLTCLVVTPKIRDLADKIREQYPQLGNLSNDRISEMVGLYVSKKDKNPDYIPTPKALVDFMEKLYNNDNKSLVDPLYDTVQMAVDEKPEGYIVEYGMGNGPKHTYRVIGNKIYNEFLKEVFKADAPNAGADRLMISALVRLQQGKAKRVMYKGEPYIVNDSGQIINERTKNLMGWGNENGDKKMIAEAAKIQFDVAQKYPESKALSGYTLHSGGATGSDFYWGAVGERFGATSNHHYHGERTMVKAPYGNTLQSEDDFVEGIAKAQAAAASLKRPWNPSYADLLARNWNQVKYADAVFAVGHIVKPGEKNAKGYDVYAVQVDGGTGNAVQMAINEGKTVHVFDQQRGKWYKNEKGKWAEEDTPTLTRNYAGIGTREINEAGKKAIQQVFEKTAEQQQGTGMQPDINSISSKTETYGVVIDTNLKNNYNTWQQQNPNGIVAYRVNFNVYNTPSEANAGRIGNPFSEGGNFGPDTVQKFYEWIVTGNNFGNTKATEAYRQAIINKLLNTPNGSPVLYYKELNRVSHATVLGYLINNKQLLPGYSQQIQAQSIQRQINKQIVDQLINHLKSIGFKVHNRAEMVAFIEKARKEGKNVGVIQRALNDIQAYIGKKARTQFENKLRKARPDMSDTEIKATLDFLHSLEDNKENTAYIKTAITWVANKSITLPQDNTKARQAFDLARKKRVDIQKYKTLGELILAPEMQPKEKEKPAFNPDEAKTFSNKRTVTTESGRVFTVYDVEDTEEGQREVCKALAAHYPMSPWCLSTFTATGEPTQSAKNYWNHYNVLSRKIAYENGKPVAFNSIDAKGEMSFTPKRYFIGGRIINRNLVESFYGLNRGQIEREQFEFLLNNDYIQKNPEWDPEDVRYILTKKGKNAIKTQEEKYEKLKEAWWDMEDIEPQETLSDNIVSDTKKMESILEAQTHVNEYQPLTQEDWYDIDNLHFDEYEQANYLNLINSIDESDFQAVQTPSGEIYGFTPFALNGKRTDEDIFLDETVISPEHPIHEYTHLWDRMVAKKNNKLWKRGVELMKQLDLWKEIENSPRYGQKWKSDEKVTPAYMEFLIASEVHSRLVGEGGEKLLNEIAEKRGRADGIIEKLKQWLLEFWKELKSTFGKFSEEELNKIDLKTFNRMTMRDFAEGTDILNAEKVDYSTPQPSGPMDIWWGSGENDANRSNPDLSNFAERPFEYQGFKFKSVEHAFQTAKLHALRELFVANGSRPAQTQINKIDELLEKLKNAKDGAEIKKIGNTRLKSRNAEVQEIIDKFFSDEKVNWHRGITEWNRLGETMMKNFIKASFEQNPQALQRLLSTGNAQFTHNQESSNSKWRTVFPRLLMEVRDELRNTTNQQNNNSNNKPELYGKEFRGIQETVAEEQIITVAPYFRNRLTTNNKAELEKLTQEVKEKAQKLANQLGLKINSVEVVGGTYLGSSEITYQYRIDSTDQEKVDLFAALMGDLSFEYQDAVIAANYVQKGQGNAIELVYTTPNGTTIEGIEKTLNDNGIEGSTFHFENGELTIIAFSEEELDNLINKLNNNTDYEYKQHSEQNSRYLDNESRRNIYKAWLETESRGQNRKLYNACSKALAICEAAARFPDEGQEPERLKAAQEAAVKWDNEHSQQGVTTQPESNAVTPDEVAAALAAMGYGVSGDIDVQGLPKETVQKPKSKIFESDVAKREGRMANFYRTFTPPQVRDRGVMIADMFSRQIDTFLESENERLDEEIEKCKAVLNDPDAPKEEKENAEIKIDEDKRLKSAYADPVNGRQKAVQAKQLSEILNDIKSELESRAKDADEEHEDDEALKYRNTIEYFVELFNASASLEIENLEGIRITDLETIEEGTQQEESEAQRETDDEVGENTSSGNDGWSFKVRYENPFNSLSKAVKRMVARIKVLGKTPTSLRNSNTGLYYQEDDLGYTKYYPSGQIYAALLSYLSQNMESADDFIQIQYDGKDMWGSDIDNNLYPHGYPTFPVLEQMKEKYPWVDQVIEILTIDYVNKDMQYNEPMFPTTYGSMASQVFNSFFKSFIPYARLDSDGATWKLTALNFEMEDKMLYDSCVSNYRNRFLLTDRSVYDKEGRIVHDNVMKMLEHFPEKTDTGSLTSMVNEYYDLLMNPDTKDGVAVENPRLTEFLTQVSEDFRSLGFDIFPEDVSYYLGREKGQFLVDKLLNMYYLLGRLQNVDSSNEDFNYALDSKTAKGKNMLRELSKGMGTVNNVNYMQSYYDSATKKTKYSYSADNYMQKMFRALTNKDKKKRQQFMRKKFMKYEWFYNHKTKTWRNKWLEEFYEHGDLFSKNGLPYLNVDNVSGTPYREWTTDNIFNIQRAGFMRQGDTTRGGKSAFYLAPIFADSPMSMLLKGPVMSMDELIEGTVDQYNEATPGALVDLVDQEMWRIKYVSQDRAKAIKNKTVKPIVNLDSKDKGRGFCGRRFCFLPELNNYTFNDDEQHPNEGFLERMIRLKNENASGDILDGYKRKAIKDIIDRRFHIYLYENGFTDLSQEEYDNEKLRYYNSVYAGASIIQITTVDLAYYKNATDFQKRFKEVYAAGMHLNTNSKYGEKTENVILLADDVITSPSYEAIKANIMGQKSLSKNDKKRILDTFKNITVADAQAFRSMHSFRSIMDMMGTWTDKHEQALKNFEKGEWSAEDFDLMMQTIKPFMYTVTEKNDGVGGSIPVPVQHKNSEICALMMYNVIMKTISNDGESSSLAKSPVYAALSEFMERKGADGKYLIHMAQYESAGKVGNQGVINISYVAHKVKSVISNPDTVELIKSYLDYVYFDRKDNSKSQDAYDKAMEKVKRNTLEDAEDNYYLLKDTYTYLLDNHRMNQKEHDAAMNAIRPQTKEEIIAILESNALITNPDGTKDINREVVQTIDFADFHQAQPTPAHHVDAEATFGSQARNIAPADLPLDVEIKLEGKGKTKRVLKGSKNVVDFYYELLNENLIEDYFGTENHKGLKELFKDKKSFKEAVEEVTRGNPKYGKDFIEALMLDENGEFLLSPNSPTLFHLMQEIVCSFFKNRITKQKINGAALIQAAGIGLDDELRLKFDKNGKPVAAECYMPLTSKRFFEPLLTRKRIKGEDGKMHTEFYLDPKKLKEAGLDKALGYRIPTENTSSMLPLIIKGFTPLQNGSAIVLPAEITALSGSDFDVDKMFLILSSFRVSEYNIGKAQAIYEQSKEHRLAQKIIDKMGGANIADIDFDDIEDEGFKEWFDKHKDDANLKLKYKTPKLIKIEYDFNKSPKENGRAARNNLILQMMYQMLTAKEGGGSILNPQGFPDVKRASKTIRILTDPVILEQAMKDIKMDEGIMPPAEKIKETIKSMVNAMQMDNEQKTKAIASLDNMTREQLIQLYKKLAKNDDIVDVLVERVLGSTDDELKKYVEKYEDEESPIFLQAFQHNHERNMAGDRQIGIYAVQGSMTAKHQRARIALRNDDKMNSTFKLVIMRRTEDGEAVEETLNVTDVDMSLDGKTLKAIGQMIGASADNGKDPNLTDMGSTTKTAPIIGYMLRCGIPHVEAALLINQPQMKNFKFDWVAMKETYGKDFLKINEPVSTKDLIANIVNPISGVSEEKKMAIAAMCAKILMQNEYIEYITKVSRADSPNGAMGNTFAKARIQRYKVDVLRGIMQMPGFPFQYVAETLSNTAVDPFADEDTVRRQLKDQPMGFLHGMYALGINSLTANASKFFFMLSPEFDETVVKPILYNVNYKKKDETLANVIDDLYEGYITYVLSGTELFGKETLDDGTVVTMEEKQLWYLQEFPNEYLRTLDANPDIKEILGNILTVSDNHRLILSDAAQANKQFNSDVSMRFDRLLDSDNPEARKLARHLLLYSYYSCGLAFSPVDFSRRFSTQFLTGIPGYKEAVAHLGDALSIDGDLHKALIKRFQDQFVISHQNDVSKLVVGGVNTGIVYSDSTVRVNMHNDYARSRVVNPALSPNIKSEDAELYKYITYRPDADSPGTLMVLNEERWEQDKSVAVYEVLIGPLNMLYDINRPVGGIVKTAEQARLDNQIDEMLKSFGYDVGGQNYGRDQDNTDNSFDYGDVLSDDFTGDVQMSWGEMSKSELYDFEGNSQLQKPLCH